MKSTFQSHSKILILLSFALNASQARAQITVENLFISWVNVITQVAPDRVPAASFTTDATFPSYELSTIVLSMHSGVGQPGGFSLKLYSDASNQPGLPLETLVGSSHPFSAGKYTYTSNGTVLAANTTYWIVAEASVGDAQANYYSWRMVSDTAQTTTGSSNWLIGDGWAERPYQSQSWGLSPSFTFQFAVTAIPEPSTYGMLALGLGMIVWLRRRRAKA